MLRLPVPNSVSPANRRAFLWNIAVVALFVAAIVSTPGLLVLGLISGGLIFGTFGWSLFHLKEVFLARDTMFRWAFAGTLSVFLAVVGTSQTTTTRYGDLAFLGMLFVMPLAFGVALAWGALGATLGVVGARRGAARRGEMPAPEAAVIGTSLMWLFALLGVVFAFCELREISLAVLLGTPLLVFVVCRGAWIGRFPFAGIASRSMRVLDRMLVRRNARRTLDFRGVAFGLLAGIATLALSVFLVPLQQSAYSTMTQVAFRIKSLDKITGGDMNILFNAATPPLAQAIVVDWDADVLREALTPPGSEAAIQARLVEMLARAGAGRIVLIHPATKSSTVALTHLTVPGAPLPTAEDTERTKRDLPKLVEAVRKVGNVVVLYDVDTKGDARVRTAAHASVLVSETLTEPFESLSQDRLTRRLAHDEKETSAERKNTNRDDVFAAFDFKPHHVSARAVLSGALVYVTDASKKGNPIRSMWLSPARVFKGRTVIVGSVLPVLTRTPRGEMLASDALAQMVEAQQGNRFVSRTGSVSAALLVLLCGLLSGLVSARRAPLDGLWRVLILGFWVASLSIFLLLFGKYVEPVGPLCAIAGAYLLVTQLTHSIGLEQRDANRRMLARFLSPEAAELLLGSTDNPYKELGLGGARRRVCVLFADIRSFTPFAERHTPEQVVEAVNSYMSAMTDALYSHGGILDKYTGDGLMAFFIIGEGEQGQRDVARAVHAARAMAQAALRVASESAEPLRVGIGMHYGEAVVGLVGSAARPDYTAMGHTVVVSARLQTIAEGGQVIISQAVREIIGETFSVEEGEPVRVKGLTDMVRPYLLLGE